MKIRNNIQTGLNTYASYSVSGMVNQNLSGVSITRLKLTGDTTYNFGTASTSEAYSYIVDAGSYKFNLGTYSSYKISPSDFPIIGATGAGLSGSFTLSGLFDGTSMWVKSQLGFFDMPIPSGGSLDADFLAFKSRVETAGGSLSATEITATNQLVVDLKAYSLWSKIKAFYPFVGASNASCRQNLKSSSHTGTFYGSMTINSSGITGDRESAYMDTALSPNTAMSYTNQHYIVYIPSGIDGSSPYECLLGSNTSGFVGIFFYLNAEGNGYLTVNEFIAPASGSFSPQTANGCWSLSLLSGTKTLYRNGSSIQAIGSVSPEDNSLPDLIIGGRNNQGTKEQFTNNTISCVSIGDGLTGTENANIYTAIQAFQTTLGRNV